ncbi:MBOAT family protein [Mucilaginibacter terrenus]|uniref:MBOAT family protein n=1 Tax=Mucilaginibacter terrenus TaxID=2482727 RepID=A0A3E2NY57_9SPHI|nr:MBOAT family O-acyltransferase [Mucilaginibacter terrenus]RFZ85958.1 MBOAT family protein [Mucilaginibacter terrenus]
MLFNSLHFVVFFLVVTPLYYILPHKFRWLLLLVASCYFYMVFIPVYILILLFTIIVDYFAGILIEQSSGKQRRLYLVMSLVANIGVLAFFKYYNFINDNISLLLNQVGVNNHIPYLSILLPVGLSFHTFQAMSYTIEVYRGNQAAERRFGIYALYVMFYPQLVAGPIERPQNLLHQFYEKHPITYENISIGLRLMLLGFFKKLVVADRLSIFVSAVYQSPGSYSTSMLITVVVFFAFQIYADFSGYSDIALGTARIMGFKLMTNFNTPFFATSVTEYWRRWHISLNTWFNDYLFTPIIVAKRDWGKFAVVFGIMVTFSISGLWHGAGWTYIIWGVLHGLAMSYEFLTKKFRKKMSKKAPSLLYNGVSMLLMFIFLCFTWIFFRANNVQDAFTVISHIAHPTGKFFLFDNNLNVIVYSLIAIIILLVHDAATYLNHGKSYFLYHTSPIVRMASYCFLLLSILLIGVFDGGQFIYFKF